MLETHAYKKFSFKHYHRMKYLGQIKIPENSKPRNFHVAKTYCFKVSISYEEIKIKLINKFF